MSKSTLLAFVAWSFFGHAMFAQSEFAVDRIPAGLLPNASAVVRVDWGVLNVVNRGRAVLETRRVVTFLRKPSDAELVLAGLEGRFFETDKMQAKVYSASGKLLWTSKKSDIEMFGSDSDYEFSDARVKQLKVTAQELPFTVEFLKRTEYKGFMTMPDWTVQRLGHAVERTDFTVNFPPDFSFEWQGFNTNLRPTAAQSREQNSLRWSANDLSAVPDEANSPFLDGVFSRLVFAPKSFQMGDQLGSMDSWAAFGEFVYRLNAGRDELSPAMQAHVRRLTAGARSPQEKIAVLYRYLQETCRYVSVQIGIGGWQTFPANHVEAKRYGDCKALSNYMKAMLRAVGIESAMALVYGGSEGCPPLSDSIVDNQFNHVILYVPSTDTWLECTSSDLPPGFLGDFTSNRHALLLLPGGGKLVRTPAPTGASNQKISHTKIVLNEMGVATVENRVVYTGEMHDYYRWITKHLKGDDLQKEYTKNLPFAISNLENLHIAANSTAPEAQIEYRAQLLNFANVNGKRLFLPLTKICAAGRSLPAGDDRQLDLFLPDTYTLLDTFTVELPGEFSIENAPTDKVLESEFGKYEVKVEQQPGRLLLFRRVEWLPIHVPSARYEEVRRFFAEVSKADARQLVLKKG